MPKRKATSIEWVGGRFPAPLVVGKETPSRPDVVFWMELPSELVVAMDVVESGSSPDALRDALLRALRHPMAGERRTPQCIRVESAALAAEVRDCVDRKVEIAVAPTPELGVLARLMAGGVRDRKLRKPPSYFEEGRMSEARIAKLFEAAAAVYATAPWKKVDDIAPIRVDIPTLGVDAACVIAIGAAGESTALLMFPSLRDYEAFHEAAEHNMQVGRIDHLGSSVLALNFEKAADVPPSMRKEAAKHGWRVAGASAYPVLDHRTPDGNSIPLTERDARIMTACAMALSGFYLRHARNLVGMDHEPISETVESEHEDAVRLTIPYDDYELFEDDDPPSLPAVAAPKLGRNDKCPCGSGKKYKQCHLPLEREAHKPADRATKFAQRDNELVLELTRFAMRKFGESWPRGTPKTGQLWTGENRPVVGAAAGR